MDRREALKKLAAGGAAAVGTTLVATSGVLADGGSTNSIPDAAPTPTATVSRSSGTVNCSLGIVAQGCDFGTPTTARVDSAINGTSLGGGTLSPAADTWVVARNPLAATVSGISGNGNNATIVLRFDFRQVCDSRPAGTTAAWRCQSFTVTIQTGGGNGTAVDSVVVATASAPASCNTPAPSAP